MTDLFSKLAEKRQRSPKVKTSRNLFSGHFDLASPLTDPSMLYQAVRWVRAIDELRPVLLAFADSPTPTIVASVNISLAVFDALKQSILDALSVDKEAFREAKKPLLRAVRLKSGGAS